MADIQGATVNFKIETKVKALTTRSPQMTEKTCGQSKWFNNFSVLRKLCLKISWLHWKSGSSNLLVDRPYSIVPLRKFAFAFVSNKLLSKDIYRKTSTLDPSGALAGPYKHREIMTQDPTKTTEPQCRVNVGCRWTESAWNL